MQSCFLLSPLWAAGVRSSSHLGSHPPPTARGITGCPKLQTQTQATSFRQGLQLPDCVLSATKGGGGRFYIKGAGEVSALGWTSVWSAWSAVNHWALADPPAIRQATRQAIVIALRREPGKEIGEEWGKVMQTSVLFIELSYCQKIKK